MIAVMNKQIQHHIDKIAELADWDNHMMAETACDLLTNTDCDRHTMDAFIKNMGDGVKAELLAALERDNKKD